MLFSFSLLCLLTRDEEVSTKKEEAKLASTMKCKRVLLFSFNCPSRRNTRSACSSPGCRTVFDKCSCGSILHIYLDELDNRSKEQQALIPNGFTEPTIINDFPIRDRKVVLHIRRHRWLDADGHNIVLNVYNLATKGTRYSEEFAAFLKERLGYLPSDSTFAGAVL